MIKMSNLRLSYGEKIIYDNFSHTFEDGLTHVIVGKSGCGKTSLLNAIANLTPHKGVVECGKISYLFQQPRLAKTTVFNNIDMAIASAYPNIEERKQVAQKYLNLAEIADKGVLATKLSGGEQQRVALARAFAYPSEVLLMDEPFKSLDLGIRKKLYATVGNLLAKAPRATVIVTHDIDEALSLADKIYLLHGAPCQLEEIATITTPILQRNLYDEQMLSLRKQLEQLL